MYLAASLLQHGFQAEIIDANASGLSDEEIGNKIKILHPDLIGIALLSEIFYPVYWLTRYIKDTYPQAKIVLGGPHVNALPERVMDEFKEADYALVGESEESIVCLCQGLEKKEDFSQVNGLYYRTNGKVVCHKPARPIEGLDSLQYPARNLLAELYKSNKYYMILVKERPVETILTSRGCPFHCRFCSNTSRQYRARSAGNVLEEIIALYSQDIRNIDIADANFTFDRDRAIRIFQLIQKEKLRIGMRIKSRTDSIDAELVEEAKKAGVYLISLGMESGSQEILDRMAKGTKIEKNILACETVMRQGLKLNTGWIVGFPGETPQTIEQTTRLITKIKPTTANINLLVPYPGTEVYLEAESEGTLVGSWSIKNNFIPWVKLPWAESYTDLERIAQKVKNKVYYRPYYLFNFAGEIVRNANFTLARYAFQEAAKSLKSSRK